MERTYNVCTKCGKADRNLTVIDDRTAVCDECLDSCYFLCDECGEYWEDIITQHWLKDGRCICDHCIDDFDEDDIEESF